MARYLELSFSFIRDPEIETMEGWVNVSIILGPKVSHSFLPLPSIAGFVPAS